MRSPAFLLTHRLPWLALGLVVGLLRGAGMAQASFTLTTPVNRLVLQRDATDHADLPVQGTWSGNPARIEARLIVMPGTTNQGTPTDWTLLATATAPGPFQGVLPQVVAGGWYSLEVRALDAESNLLVSVAVDRIGVGDVFVTAGQSNAGCFGAPTQRPDDDRVSAYTLSSRTWRWAVDPQPDVSGGMGSGGSPWPRLGSLLVQSNRVPVAFVGLAAGATTVNQWAPGTPLYRNLTNTLVRFGPHGVRAVLWHQGESDSLETTSATAYAQRLSNLVARARSAAGWSVPWGIAEASFHPAASRAQEEAVAAGQRRFTAAMPDCFRGPRTDDFHLEGKLSDTVHFNTIGLSEHALRWAQALTGFEDLTPKNAAFEDDPDLADGAAATSRQLIGWNRLNAAGTGIAVGQNGIFNPDDRTYPGSADTVNGGLLPNLNGRHVGTLGSTQTNAAFLQTLSATLQPSTVYTFTVAVGVRTNPASFGGYLLDLLANGLPLGAGTAGNLASLDALAGGSAVGAFTRVSTVVTSAVSVVPNQPLALRITKPQGANTFLDFDDVRITRQPTPYGTWQQLHWGRLTDPTSLPDADPDSDGYPNLVEALLSGANPRVADPVAGPEVIVRDGEEYLQFQWSTQPDTGRGNLEVSVSTDLLHWSRPASAPQGDVWIIRERGLLSVQFRRRTLQSAFLRLEATP
jgi:hypothetical protein